MDTLLEVLIKIGKFILGAFLKTIVLASAILLIWLIICIISKNSLSTGWHSFTESKVLTFVEYWLLLIFALLTSGDIQETLIGIAILFVPVFLISVCTPNPDIELYDDQGNLWTLRKN